MTYLLDSSVLVAGLWSGHPKHAEALAWLAGARNKEITAAIAQHAIAETYAVLTGLPVSPRLQASSVLQVLEDLLGYVDIAALGPDDYRLAMREAAERGFLGRAIYDLLHVLAAEAAGCGTILTLNSKDFNRLSTRHSIAVTPV